MPLKNDLEEEDIADAYARYFEYAPPSEYKTTPREKKGGAKKNQRRITYDTLNTWSRRRRREGEKERETKAMQIDRAHPEDRPPKRRSKRVFLTSRAIFG